MTVTCQKNLDVIANAQPYRLVMYADEHKDAWENMVGNSVNGTFLHTRKFLSYHGDKFEDRSLLVYDQDYVLRAIFPAAINPEYPISIVSHPGITYGGLLHDGWLHGQRCVDVFKGLCEFYAGAGFEEMKYKAIPWIYHRMPAQDDIFALFQVGAIRYRTDLSATIDLQNRGKISERRKRAYKKAQKLELMISDNWHNLPAYWDMLAINLKDKYNKTPVHSLLELQALKEKFPREIQLITAYLDNQIQAGCLLFNSDQASHAQYFASNEPGRESGAVDLVIEACLKNADESGKRFFDFGISTEQAGQILNDNLHTFKSEFGSGASVYEFYKVNLSV